MKRILFLCMAVICLTACKKGKEEIPVSSVSISQPTAEMTEGETLQLKATVLPADATVKTVEWTSSKQSVATITDKGLVTAIAEGISTITASAGGKSASCKVIVTKKFIAVESIELDKTSLELVEGDSDILIATVKPDDATDKTITWISSDDSIVTVDDEGGIKAIKEGKASIAAKAGDKTAMCEVTVSKKVIPVESITLDRTSISMVEDESTVLTATVKPDNATDKTVTWSSSDTGVATVKDGRVTSIKEGKATITAKAGEKEATCEVIVSKRIIEVTSVTLNYPVLSLVKGEEQVLVATVEPDNATDKNITWTSSNAQVASVDRKGKVKALKSGTATITANAGEKTATCEVTVTTPVESVALDRTSMTLEEGQSTTLIATISPNDADEKTVTWSSSDADIVTVDQSGKVTAVKEGTATITAKVGGLSATCEVSVKKQVIQVTSITLNKTSLTLEKGKSETLTATVKPDNATDKTVNWSSSDSSIVTVDSDGKVTAVKGGEAVITAKAGEQSATCTVTVTVPVTGIELNESSLTLEKGQTVTLVATVSPEDATDKTVTWSSSDESVATVSDGEVTALREGQAYITAQAGDKSASCRVTVEAQPVTRIKVTYQEAEGEVVNPERGMYTTFEIHKASYNLTASSVKAKVATGHTVQLLEFYLTSFMNKDISDEYLAMIQNCFDAMRDGGAKAIVRFAYKDHYSDGEVMEPEVSQVLSHVAQLKPILQRNEDVLFVLQAGFVGAWGEWYYTTHFNMNPVTDAQYAPRKQLTEALLDAVPTSRQIELRTPEFKMKMYKLSLSDTLRASTAHSGSALSRLGGHNDCFGADASDMGTFGSKEDRAFWKAETRYTIMGGETCQLSSYCLCQQSLKDLEDYHWTYLHEGYNRDVLNRWKKDGCMDEIKARLGYRLVLKEVEYDTPKAGQSCTVTLRLKNKGYAAPMNPRQAYLVWKNDNGATQRIELGSDPRTWHPGDTQVTVSFTPQSARGTMYLELSDPLLPDNPAYSIALANQDVFDAETGYNRLFEVL